MEKISREEEELRKQVDEIYTSLSVAKEEIWRRWNDKELEKRVSAFIGEVPEVLQTEPKAVITRQLISPDYEFLTFLDLAKMTGLKSLCWEFLDDIFITTNKDKADLARMAFFQKINKNFQANISYKKVIDLTGKEEKKKFRDIKTLWGESFVDFHHGLLKSITNRNFELFDASSWYSDNGNSSKKYYPHFLALFIRHGIMFENFLVGDGSESIFTRDVVFPAFKKVTNKFGLKPLIVRIIPEECTNDFFWWCYPEYVKDLLNKK